jgi:hypothetical protein
MSVTINASVANGLQMSSDLSGNLQFQNNGVNLPMGGVAPAFSAYNNATQSITSSVSTKVLYQLEEFDTNNNFASSTFTPTVAGYYQVTGCVSVSSTGATVYFTSIYKNGSEYKRGQDLRGLTTSQAQQFNTALVYCNGTTDTIEIYVFNNGASPVIGSGATATYFQACLVRGA